MSELIVWRAEDAKERASWLHAWKSWVGKEASGHPTYVELFAAEGQYCRCAWLNSPYGKVFFPFIVRPLAREDWATRSDAVDITNAYGYGGPFCWDITDKEKLAADFWQQFDEWAMDNHAVSLFARLTLFEEDRLDWPDALVALNPNVVRFLTQPVDEIWMQYAHKVRKNVQRAERSGLTVAVDLEGRTLARYLEIYLGTMDRVNASSWYYFPRTFYERMIAEMPGNFAFFHVYEGQRVIASELAIISDTHIYSFLGGTEADAFNKRPNDLLKHEMVKWGIQNGKSAFVLGGGFRGEDGIFHYKKSFAPDGVMPFFVGTRVYDETTCESLVAQRREWEATQDRAWQPQENYFPAYRS